jgi:hypothetical protein
MSAMLPSLYLLTKKSNGDRLISTLVAQTGGDLYKDIETPPTQKTRQNLAGLTQITNSIDQIYPFVIPEE